MRTLVIIVLFSVVSYAAPRGQNKGTLVIGSNTMHRIFYSTSSNFGVNHEGRKAIDTDYNSSWISGKDGPHWIEIDFGIKRIMDKIIIWPGQVDNYQTIKRMIIQFMYNDEWFDFSDVEVKKEEKGFFDFFKAKPAMEEIKVELGGIDASKFRIFIPDDATYKGYAAIAEIETYIGSNKLKYFDERLLGMCMPVKNGLLPKENASYPNAPRKYRGGVHAGLDILHYHDDETYEPLEVTKETQIRAANDGVIIRADWDYKPLTANEWLNQSAYYRTHPRTFVKRSFGGIQVWIDHKDGIVTTYNHLSKIDDKIKTGVEVKKGQRIGWAGNSGLMGEAEGKDYGVHLHFEIWIDGYYLGKGMELKDIKQYFTWIFLER